MPLFLKAQEVSFTILINERPIAEKPLKPDALANMNQMAKQKIRPTRRSAFSRTKAYIWYVKVLKNHCNTVGRAFCDAIKLDC